MDIGFFIMCMVLETVCLVSLSIAKARAQTEWLLRVSIIAIAAAVVFRVTSIGSPNTIVPELWSMLLISATNFAAWYTWRRAGNQIMARFKS